MFLASSSRRFFLQIQYKPDLAINNLENWLRTAVSPPDRSHLDSHWISSTYRRPKNLWTPYSTLSPNSARSMRRNRYCSLPSPLGIASVIARLRFQLYSKVRRRRFLSSRYLEDVTSDWLARNAICVAVAKLLQRDLRVMLRGLLRLLSSPGSQTPPSIRTLSVGPAPHLRVGSSDEIVALRRYNTECPLFSLSCIVVRNNISIHL